MKGFVLTAFTYRALRLESLSCLVLSPVLQRLPYGYGKSQERLMYRVRVDELSYETEAKKEVPAISTPSEESAGKIEVHDNAPPDHPEGQKKDHDTDL